MNVVLSNPKGFVTSFVGEVTKEDVIHHLGHVYTYWYRDNQAMYFKYARSVHIDRPPMMMKEKHTAEEWCFILGLPHLPDKEFEQMGVSRTKTKLFLSEFFMFVPRGSEYA